MEVTTPRSFTRMDESTAEQWEVIAEESRRNQPRVADRILMLLRSLGDVTDGFATDQFTHCLQTATLADLPALGAAILQGQVQGRVVVDVNA